MISLKFTSLFFGFPRRDRQSKTSTRPALALERLERRDLFASLEVSTSADSGIGSLRHAILVANESPGRDTIVFRLAPNDLVIRPLSQLPFITEEVDIDGSTQPGYSNIPLVEIDGSSATAGSSGFNLTGNSISIIGLAIHSFPLAGIWIHSGGGHVVQRNHIGINQQGSIARPNLDAGIVLQNAFDCIIGGNSNSGNLISGNAREGIRIEEPLAERNKVQGNRIGTDFLGHFAIPNGTDGILIAHGARHNHVGTDSNGIDDHAEGNVISGNNRNGVFISNGISNIIAGNSIGLRFDRTAPLGNKENGVVVDHGAMINQIGSQGDGIADELETNWIAGNGMNGISIFNSVSNSISGNYIGATLPSQVGFGNLSDGVGIFSNSSKTLVGFANEKGRANIISGNGRNGVWIGESNDNIVAGNWVGISLTGDSALPNAERGIQLTHGAKGNIIGTDDNEISISQERNVISGNRYDGIALFGPNTEGNFISGNFIGVDPQGMRAIPNQHSGVTLYHVSNNIIGTLLNDESPSLTGNLISGNLRMGVDIVASSFGNAVLGNSIGRNSSDSESIPNNLGGVRIDQSSQNLIGSRDPQHQNHIVDSVVVLGNSYGNRISGNTIRPGLHPVALDLAADGTSLNDDFDRDNGPNKMQNHPVIEAIATDGVRSIAFGSISSTPTNRAISRIEKYDIELFKEDSASTLAYQYVASSTVESTNNLGHGAWLATWSSALSIGDRLNATATDLDGNTSEHSQSKTTKELLPILSSATSVLEKNGQLRVKIQRGRIPIDQELQIQLSSTSRPLITPPSSVSIPGGINEVEFDVQLQNNEIRNLTDRVFLIASTTNGFGALQIEIIDDDIYWHNATPGLGNDVDRDNAVTPLDVLFVVNLLNESFPTVLANQTPLSPVRYIDTDNDSMFTPLDVLAIINYINVNGNSGTLSGEGENDTWLNFEAADQVLRNALSGYLDEDLARRRRSKL